MLTWAAVAALAVGVFGQRLLGAVALPTDRLTGPWQRVLASLPLAIISAVIALQAFAASGSFELDARALGVAAAGVGAWRRWPIFVVVLLAAGVTATARALT